MHVQTNAGPSISSLIFSWKMSMLLHNPIEIAWCSHLPKGSSTAHTSLELGFKLLQHGRSPCSDPGWLPIETPSGFRSMSSMFGMGCGFLNILLFSSRKSEMNLADPSVFGTAKAGAAHSERFTFLKTPILTRHSTLLSVSARVIVVCCGHEHWSLIKFKFHLFTAPAPGCPIEQRFAFAKQRCQFGSLILIWFGLFLTDLFNIFFFAFSIKNCLGPVQSVFCRIAVCCASHFFHRGIYILWMFSCGGCGG